MIADIVADSEADATQRELVAPCWVVDCSTDNAIVVLSTQINDSDLRNLEDGSNTPFTVDRLVCDARAQWHLKRMIFTDMQCALNAIEQCGVTEMIVCVRPSNDAECKILVTLTGVVDGLHNEGVNHES